MAEEASKRPGPFDVKTIEFLVGLMSKHDVSEVDLCEGEQRIRLRRGSRVVTTVSTPVIKEPSIPQPPPLPRESVKKEPDRKLIDVKSPTIGTFYAQEKEGAKPYVTIGSRVTATTTVGLIEAMKLFSEIPAGCDGVIAEILVENQQPVEHNQVLFRVDPGK